MGPGSSEQWTKEKKFYIVPSSDYGPTKIFTGRRKDRGLSSWFLPEAYLSYSVWLASIPYSHIPKKKRSKFEMMTITLKTLPFLLWCVSSHLPSWLLKTTPFYTFLQQRRPWHVFCCMCQHSNLTSFIPSPRWQATLPHSSRLPIFLLFSSRVIIAWIVRGAAKKSFAELSQLIRLKKPQILFLSETKITPEKYDLFLIRWGTLYELCFVSSVGRSSLGMEKGTYCKILVDFIWSPPNENLKFLFF